MVHRGVHGAKILPNFAPMYIKVQTRTKVGTDGKNQSDEAIKAHFNLAVLAYWVVSATQYQLRRKGCKISWREVKRIADTQVVVSTIAKRIDGNEVEVRQCTEPEQQLSDLYKKLEFTSPSLKRRRKICVVHFS